MATIRRPVTDAPALTLTLSIPLAGDDLTPQAYRLIEAVRDLVEAGNGTVTMAPVETLEPIVAAGFEAPAEPSGPEVRLMAASRQVVLDGEPLPLTRLEFDLLQFLAENPRRVFTRAQLLTGVWGYAGERTVDVHVRRLRVKLGNRFPLITTVYGVGYRLSDDARVVILPHD